MENETAKSIFKKYRGMYFFMMREGNGDYELYQSYHIPKQQETVWLREMQAEFKESLALAQSDAEFLSAFFHYIDVTIELHDQPAVWDLCHYIEQNISTRSIDAMLNCTAALLRTRTTVLPPIHDIQQRFQSNLLHILAQVERRTQMDPDTEQKYKNSIMSLQKRINEERLISLFLPSNGGQGR